MSEPVANLMTVDVEDWFHILDSAEAPDRERWSGLESRVERNTERILEQLEGAGVRATFFIVGWVAWHHPGLVRRIAAAGHEVASHSFWHELLQRHERASLRRDLERSKKLLEDLTGGPVRGFRAPGGSLTQETSWALDLLCELGFDYDSSICPGLSSHGGYPGAPVGPHRIRCAPGELVEIPSSTVGVAGRRVPYAGGGYLRLFPYRLIRASLESDNRRGRPANVYLHPREIDPDQPRMRLPARRRFKYYVGLRSTEGKLRALLRDFRFTACADWIDAHGAELTEILDVRATAASHPPQPDPALVPPPPPGEPQTAR